MRMAHEKFMQIISDTKNSCAVYSYLDTIVKPPLDFSDILRWQWAQSLSALDKFIHDIVRIGMVQTHLGRRPQTDKYKNFSFSISALYEIKENPSAEIAVFEKQIILAHSYKSFQTPDNISNALSLIWGESNKWSNISERMGSDAHAVKTFLKNSVIRRNQIVHEGDYASHSMARQSISQSDVNEVIEFIETLGNAICACVS